MGDEEAFAALYDPARGSAISWILMMFHHRSVSLVRSAEGRVRPEIRLQRRETAIPASWP